MVTTRSKTKIIGSMDDLLIEILLRLPAKSIIRFKSVSKHWMRLLSDRSFTIRFDKLSKSPGIFFGNKYVPFDSEDQITSPLFRSLDFCSDPRGITILQSCNGLLLCSSLPRHRDDCKYYVLNPTTKQFAIIPPVPGVELLPLVFPGVDGVYRSICFMGLAFHQTDCTHYKVICARVIDIRHCQIQLYSSDTGEWKVSIQSFLAPVVSSGDAVYWNGAVFFPPSGTHHFYYKIDVEEYRSLPLPVEIRKPDSSLSYFGESRGHLHLVVKGKANTLRFNVYEMLADYSGWFVKYEVELDELQGAFPQRSHNYSFEVIDVVRGEKDEDTFIVLLTPSKLIKYNVHDKSFKLMSNHTKYRRDGLPSFHRYIEALASF